MNPNFNQSLPYRVRSETLLTDVRGSAGQVVSCTNGEVPSNDAHPAEDMDICLEGLPCVVDSNDFSNGHEAHAFAGTNVYHDGHYVIPRNPPAGYQPAWGPHASSATIFNEPAPVMDEPVRLINKYIPTVGERPHVLIGFIMERLRKVASQGGNLEGILRDMGWEMVARSLGVNIESAFGTDAEWEAAKDAMGKMLVEEEEKRQKQPGTIDEMDKEMADPNLKPQAQGVDHINARDQDLQKKYAALLEKNTELEKEIVDLKEDRAKNAEATEQRFDQMKKSHEKQIKKLRDEATTTGQKLIPIRCKANKKDKRGDRDDGDKNTFK